MKKVVLIVCSIAAIALVAKPASTTWDPTPKKHRHGIGMRCPHCGFTWDGVPKSLNAKEASMLRVKMRQFFNHHLRVVHGIIVNT